MTSTTVEGKLYHMPDGCNYCEDCLTDMETALPPLGAEPGPGRCNYCGEVVSEPEVHCEDCEWQGFIGELSEYIVLNPKSGMYDKGVQCCPDCKSGAVVGYE